MTDDENTIGEYRFGLASEEAHARYAESLYRSLDDLRNLGELPPGTTYYDVADAILDTVINYSALGPILATELSDLVRDAVEQLEELDLEFEIELEA
jgi:hypothetical protein